MVAIAEKNIKYIPMGIPREEIKQELYIKKNEIRRMFNLTKQGEIQLREQMQTCCGVGLRYPPDGIRIIDRCHPEYYLPYLVDFIQHRSEMLDTYRTRKYEKTGRYKKNGKQEYEKTDG